MLYSKKYLYIFMVAGGVKWGLVKGERHCDGRKSKLFLRILFQE